MVVYCCVDGCFNRRQFGSKIHFFSFPLKNELRTTEWMKAINRQGFKPSTSSRICSDHFTLNDFKNSPGGSYRLYLTDKSCPSIFPMTFDESRKKKKKPTFTEEFKCYQNVDCILGTNVSENASIHDSEITILRDNFHKKKKIPTFTEEFKCYQNVDCILENVDCILGTEVSEKTSVHDNEITISRDNLLITPSTIQRTLPRLRRQKQPETLTESLLRKKIKYLQLKVRRCEHKINNLKELVKDLQAK